MPTRLEVSSPPYRPPADDETAVARGTMRRVNRRLLPLLFALFVCNYVDRTNVAMAALQMNRDLHFSNTAYGFGTGIFFLGYALFEVPSNLILARVGRGGGSPASSSRGAWSPRR